MRVPHLALCVLATIAAAAACSDESSSNDTPAVTAGSNANTGAPPTSSMPPAVGGMTPGGPVDGAEPAPGNTPGSMSNNPAVPTGPVDTGPVGVTEPGDPAPVDPAPVDTAPVDPAPVDTAPVDTAPVDPAPVDPAPVDTAPVDPAPVDTTPVDPGPVDSMTGERPCDIYAAAGQECVAAYSTVRSLLSTYTGPLYQVRVGSSEYNIGGERVTNPDQAIAPRGGGAVTPYQTTPEPGMLVDIPQTANGIGDAAVLQENCPIGTTCTVSLIYDQSGRGNDLPVAKAGRSDGGDYAALDDFETPMNNRAMITIGGQEAHSLYMEPRQGYRLTAPGDGLPLRQEPQGMYMLADGTHAGSACCWDFGNVTPNPVEYSEMNTLFFGEAFWGDGAGQPPWFGADFEAGVWMGGSVAGDPGWGELNATERPPNPQNPSMAGVEFALGFLKTDDDADNTYVLRMADVSTASEIQTAYRGRYPKLSYAGHGTDNKGAVVIGVGGDNSNNSFGTFYEGAIVAGFPDDATELAVMQNIQAAGYGQ